MFGTSVGGQSWFVQWDWLGSQAEADELATAEKDNVPLPERHRFSRIFIDIYSGRRRARCPSVRYLQIFRDSGNKFRNAAA